MKRQSKTDHNSSSENITCTYAGKNELLLSTLILPTYVYLSQADHRLNFWEHDDYTYFPRFKCLFWKRESVLCHLDILLQSFHFRLNEKFQQHQERRLQFSGKITDSVCFVPNILNHFSHEYFEKNDKTHQADLFPHVPLQTNSEDEVC